MTEISLTIDWTVWVPIVVSILALVITVRNQKNRASRQIVMDVEQKIEQAHSALKECEENLKVVYREKDELRRDKVALLEQIARLTNRLNGQRSSLTKTEE